MYDHILSEQRIQADPQEKTLHMLGFYLGEEIFCVDVSFVKEVILYAQPTQLKNLPGCVRGMLSIRGRMIPVFDLADMIGLEPLKPHLNSAILIIECQNVRVGLIVEKIYNLLWLSSSMCVEVPGKMSGLEIDFLSFAISQKDRLIFALDVQKIMNSWHVTTVKEVITDDAG